MSSLFDHRLWKALQKVAAIQEHRTLAVFEVYVTPAEAASFIAAVEAKE